jgi:hypothetical protein
MRCSLCLLSLSLLIAVAARARTPQPMTRLPDPNAWRRAPQPTPEKPSDDVQRGLRSDGRNAQSLVNACSFDIPRLCPRALDVGQCLSLYRDRLSSRGCLDWVEARDVCLGDIKRLQCTDEFVKCLVRTPEHVLSLGCRRTPLYRSVAVWKRQMERRNGKG